MDIKYDRIGDDYNNTRKADPYLTSRLLEMLDPDSEMKYADIGCGTGNYTIAIKNSGINIVGIDPSEKMLNIARQRNPDIQWISGTSEHTGLTDESIDGIICTLTLHHWPDLDSGFQELNRVLCAGGRIVIFTSTPEQMEGYWLKHFFPKMLDASIQQMPSLVRVSDALERNGFEITQTEKYFVQPDLQDHFLYCGKEQPELYLNPEIRNGISSFADLANFNEIQSGLSQLKEDIENDSIRNIINGFDNDSGDYLFVVAEKF
ncbi:MAG: methyltransferase domain-containing protein [Bacteroidetes bacterium]|nr:methyltransferase domain-containing protein [Bacteroidota bacterium]